MHIADVGIQVEGSDGGVPRYRYQPAPAAHGPGGLAGPAGPAGPSAKTSWPTQYIEGELVRYAWFHRQLGRARAAQLVMHAPRWCRTDYLDQVNHLNHLDHIEHEEDGDIHGSHSRLQENYGVFLVRLSDTRPGEFVLTFNCFGRPKVSL